MFCFDYDTEITLFNNNLHTNSLFTKEVFFKLKIKQKAILFLAYKLYWPLWQGPLAYDYQIIMLKSRV